MTAAFSLMNARGLDSPPGTVTAELTVKFLKPTPIERTLHLKARVTKNQRDRLTVEGTIEVNGVQTVSMRGVFVEVKEGHPGFGKWS